MADTATIADRILLLSLDLDPKSVKASLAQVQTMRAGLKSLVSDQKALSLSTNSVGNSYQKLSANAVEVRNQFLKNAKVYADQISVLDRLRRAQTQTQASSGAGGGGVRGVGQALRLVGNVSSVAGLDTGVGRLGSIASQAAPLLEGLGTSTATVAAAAGIAGVAIAGLSIAVGEASKTFDEGKRRVDTAFGGLRTYFELVKTSTTESIKAGLLELEVKREVALEARKGAQRGIEALREASPAFDAVDKFTEDIGSRIAQAFGQQGQKQGGLVSSIFGLTAQAQIADDEVGQLDEQIKAFTDALGSNEVAARDATEAHKEMAVKLEQSRIEMAQVEKRAAEEEAQILQRSADQKIALAKRTAEQEAQALTNLQRSLVEDRIKLGQSVADARLNYQREEAQSARAHYRTLKQIRKDAEADEFDLILARDFSGLSALRRNTDKKLNEEDDRYSEERTQRLTALKNQLGDQQKAFIRERQQKVRQYNQQLTDLRQNQIRELKANDEAARIDLQRLHARLTQELALKADAYTAILQLEANYVARMRAIHGQSTGSTAPINTTKLHEQKRPGLGGFASGGQIPAGRTGEVNERGRESWSMDGKTVWLPNARGYFTPTQGGTVNPVGSAGGGISFGDIVVQGGNQAEIRRNVHQIVDRKLTEAFEALTA